MPEIFYTTLKLVIVVAVFCACYLVNYKRAQLEEEYKQHMGGAGAQSPSQGRY
jgi:hypothetical protein